MSALFEFGFSYTEWKHSVHCMLMKADIPFIHRLLFIQLFEGSFNGALKLLFGRQLMVKQTKTPKQPMAAVNERAATKQWSEYSRLMRNTMAMLDIVYGRTSIIHYKSVARKPPRSSSMSSQSGIQNAAPCKNKRRGFKNSFQTQLISYHRRQWTRQRGIHAGMACTHRNQDARL